MRLETCSGALLAFGLFLAPFACGSDDTGAAQNGSDASTSSDVAIGNDANSSPIDAGCTASQENANDGGCVSVVPAGSRKLALEVNPPAALTYTTEVDVAKSIGVSLVPFTLPWSSLEPTPDGGTPAIDTSLFADLSAVYSTRTLSLLVSIPLVDTVSVLAPSDLVNGLTAGTLAFDDASVIARYEKLLDAMFTTLGPNVHVPYLLVANEENIYLAAKPDAQWTALANFYAAIKGYLATKQPATIVGMNLSFGGLLDASQKTHLTALFGSSPDVFVSYYLGDNGFGSAASTTVPADIDTMIAFAGARPLVLKEFGYATGTTGHDVSGQVPFITDLFQSWDAHASQIPLAIISRMYDGNISDCTTQAAAYGQAGNADFIQFLCTLGVRKIDDTTKPAWARLVDAASRRGF